MTRTHAAPLNETALHPQLIEHYVVMVRSNTVKQSTAERERKILRAIAGLPARVERRAASTSAMPVAPYRDDEVSKFRTWADLQSDTYRQACVAVVTLGAACGVTRAEMAAARGDDIVPDADGYPSLKVGGKKTRTVPALHGWAAEFTFLADVGDAPLLPVRYDQLYSHYLSAKGQEQPSPQRLRATWIINHLSHGVHIDVLLAASGLISPDSLKRFLPYVTHPDSAARLEMLRSNGATGTSA